MCPPSLWAPPSAALWGRCWGWIRALAAAVALVATFCAVTNCPFASIVLGVELFGAESMLLFALACAVSYLLSGQYSLYSGQQIMYSKINNEKVDKPAH